jgi:hypothetical protein
LSQTKRQYLSWYINFTVMSQTKRQN